MIRIKRDKLKTKIEREGGGREIESDIVVVIILELEKNNFSAKMKIIYGK